MSAELEQLPSFQSEFAAHSSSVAEFKAKEDIGTQPGSPAGSSSTSGQQDVKSSPQKNSLSPAINPGINPTIKPALKVGGLGLMQTQVHSIQLDTSVSKNGPGPVGLRDIPEAKSTAPDKADSLKQMIQHDRVMFTHNLDAPNQLLLLNPEVSSQGATAVPDNAPSPIGETTESNTAEAPKVMQAGKDKSTSVQGNLAVAMQIRTTPQDEEIPHRAVSDEADAPELSAGTATNGTVRGQELGSVVALTERPEHRSSEPVEVAAPVLEMPTNTGKGATNTSSAPETKSAPGPEFQAELEKLRTEPVRGAHVQIAGENNESVDIRLFERNGALSVTVRSGDANLTRALQDHVPELTTRLSSDHYRAQTWTPDFSRTQERANSDAGNSSKHDNGTQNEQNANERRGNKGHQQQPGWVDELEAQPTPFFRKG